MFHFTNKMPITPIRRMLLLPGDGIAALTESIVRTFLTSRKKKVINLNVFIKDSISWSVEEVLSDIFLLDATNRHEEQRGTYELVYYQVRSILERQTSALVGFNYISRVNRGSVQCLYNGLTLIVILTESTND